MTPLIEDRRLESLSADMIAGHIPISMRPAQSSRVWLVTFTDLVLLMLTFFVLLFSMADVDLARFGAFARSMGQSMAPLDQPETILPTMDFTIPRQNRTPAEDLGYLQTVIASGLAADPRFARVGTRLTEEYLVVSLPSSLLFDEGSASLSQTAQEAVFEVAGQLSVLDNAIAVAGHAGPAPLGDAPFLTKWELSLARAAAVANALTASGYPRDVMVLARGDADFTSRAAGLTPSARALMATAADRVDIIVLPYNSGT